jgi:anti-sigma B factor antagonist
MCALGFGGSVEQAADVTTLRLHGEADLAVRNQFQELIDRALATGDPRVVVDMSELRYLESACLRILLHAHDVAEARDTQLVVRGATGIVQRVLEVSGVAEILSGPDAPTDFETG